MKITRRNPAQASEAWAALKRATSVPLLAGEKIEMVGVAPMERIERI